MQSGPGQPIRAGRSGRATHGRPIGAADGSDVADDGPVDRPTTVGAPGAWGPGPRAPGAPHAVPGLPGRRSAGVVVLLGVAVVASALAGPWDPRTRTEIESGFTQEPFAPAQPVPTAEPLIEALEGMDIEPWDLTWLWLGLAGLVACAVLYFAVRWLRYLRLPHFDGPPDAAGILAGGLVLRDDVVPDLPTLREGLEDADEHLRSSQRPADAIVAAWVALEDAAERSGIVRDPASTPTEFTVEVLDRAPVDPAATRTLLGLYLRARFSEEQMGPGDVVVATAAVRSLADALAREPEAPDEPDEAGRPGLT